MEWALGVVAIVAILAAYATWLSGRIARLHARVAASYVALDAQLARRADAAAMLAHRQRVSHPDGSERVCAAAKACLQALPDDREAVENDLTRALAALMVEADDPAATELLAASRRLAVARQVHNDAVRDTLGLRSARLPRALRLGGRHPLPSYFDIAEPLEFVQRPVALPAGGVADATGGADSTR